MKNLTKIVIVLLVILMVAGVYLLKNRGADISMSPAGSSAQSVSQQDVAMVTANQNFDETMAVTEPDIAVFESESEQQDIADDRIPLEFTVFDYDFIFSQGLPVLLDFGSASCGPCQMMKPDLTAFYEETYGKVLVQYADVWKDASLTGGLPVSAVPTQYFFNADGTPYNPSDEIREKIFFTQYAYRDTGELALTCHIGIIGKEDLYAIFRDMGAEI